MVASNNIAAKIFGEREAVPPGEKEVPKGLLAVYNPIIIVVSEGVMFRLEGVSW